MFDKRHLFFLLGCSSLVLVSILNLCAARLRTRDDRAHRKALQRWEGEGGNLTLPATTEAVRGKFSQDTTP